MNLMTLNDNVQTMTSREIAELVESRHDSVKRTMETLADKGLVTFTQTVEKGLGRPLTVYHVGKRDSYIVVAQLCPEFTARLVDRWQELEEKQAPALNLNDPKQLLGLLQNYAERTLELEQKVEEAAPKVEFVEKYVDSEGLLGFREVAKMLKVTEVVLRDWLISKSIIYRLGSAWAFSSGFLACKRGEHRTGTYGGKVRTSIKFTPKGFAYIAGRIVKP